MNSYFKLTYRNKKDENSATGYKKVRTINTSNPDIGISRVANTTAAVQDEYWGQISDHRPVAFTMPVRLKLKDQRRRVAKSLFYCPDAIKAAKSAYSTGVDELLDELKTIDERDEEGAQKLYTKLEHFVTEPWEKVIR